MARRAASCIRCGVRTLLGISFRLSKSFKRRFERPSISCKFLERSSAAFSNPSALAWHLNPAIKMFLSYLYIFIYIYSFHFYLLRLAYSFICLLITKALLQIWLQRRLQPHASWLPNLQVPHLTLRLSHQEVEPQSFFDLLQQTNTRTYIYIIYMRMYLCIYLCMHACMYVLYVHYIYISASLG